MATIRHIQIYSDASGAPAVVDSDGYVYTMDTIKGEITCTCIRPVSGSRVASKIAAEQARRAYVAARQVDAEWLGRNVEMYA